MTSSAREYPDFMRLWGAQTVSVFGSQFTYLALPLTAITLMNANPGELGLLSFVSTIPWLVFGLFVGAWVDQHHRRRIMISSNILRGCILALIPVAYVAGIITQLGLPFLYLVSFVTGLLRVFFDVSYQSYLPSILPKEQLVKGNSRLEASNATATVFGPSVAGIVISLIRAPLAITMDAVSFFASALTLKQISKEEHVAHLGSRSIFNDIREGLSIIINNKSLRSIATSTGTFNFFLNAGGAIYLLYFAAPLPAGLGIPASSVALVAGLVLGAGSVGGLVGAFLALRFTQKVGVGPAIVSGLSVAGIGGFTFYFAGPLMNSHVFDVGGFEFTQGILSMMGGWLIANCGAVIFNINQVSFRQSIVSTKIQGRMNASMRFLVWGAIPFGGLSGGILGTLLGLRTAIGIASLGMSIAFLWVLVSPIRSAKSMPEPLQ